MNPFTRSADVSAHNGTPFTCPRPHCQSPDVIYGTAIERLVPDRNCPKRIVVGHNVVCNKCGLAFAVTFEGVYQPNTGPARQATIEEIAPQRRTSGSPAWSQREP